LASSATKQILLPMTERYNSELEITNPIAASILRIVIIGNIEERHILIKS
jgi:hypothetical protein